MRMHPDKFIEKFKGACGCEPDISVEERADLLQVLSLSVAAKRKAAVDARKSSGIETIWINCEEAYLGIDDANRHEFSDAKWAKPMSTEGPLTSNKISGGQPRSTAFVRLTSRYVDHAAAKLAEILLPIDDKAFSFEPTPNPDLIKKLDNNKPLQHPETGQPIMTPAPPQVGAAPPTGLPPGSPAPAPFQGAPSAAPGVPPAPGVAPVPGQPPSPALIPVTGGDLLKMVNDQASDAAKKAETRIYDWMVESQYPAETRKVIHDAARLGVGVLKGPYPEIRTSKAITRSKKGKKDKDVLELRIEKKVVPAVKWIDPWNFFPDEACSENIHDGNIVFERDYLSKKGLRELKKDPTYLADMIDKVLEEGPGKIYMEGRDRLNSEKVNKKRFEIWYCTGMQKRKDMVLAGAEGADQIPKDVEEVPAIVTMVNTTVIKAVMHPLDSGNFPYHVIPWSRRPGSWAGVGVAEQIDMPQKMVNASTRALLNNAGLSSGVQIVMDQTGIKPADGSWVLTPNKIWYKTGESNVPDVRAAFFAVIIPSVQKEMMGIIEYGMKLAEESTSIPMVTQGLQGPSVPETFGAAQLQDNNAHTWLRSIGYRYDDCITEPLVNDFYEWLLLDEEVPDDEKGDYYINAHGSAAMIERAIQEQTLLGMFQAVANPAFSIDPKKLFIEYLKAKRIDPRGIMLSEEDQKKQDEAPPTPPIQIQVETLRGQNDLALVNAKAQADLQAAQAAPPSTGAVPQADHTIDVENLKAATAIKVQEAKSQAELARAQKDLEIATQNGQFKIKELELQREIALLQYAHEKEMKLNDVKAELAKAAMDSQTKRDLATAEIQLAKNENASNRAVDIHKHNTSLVRDEMSTPVTP